MLRVGQQRAIALAVGIYRESAHQECCSPRYRYDYNLWAAAQLNLSLPRLLLT